MESQSFQLKKGKLTLSGEKFTFLNNGQKLIREWDVLSTFMIIFGIAFFIFSILTKGVWVEYVIGTGFVVWGVLLIRRELKRKKIMIVGNELNVDEISRAETTVDLGQDWMTVKIFTKAGNVKDFVLHNSAEAGRALVNFLNGRGIKTVSQSF